MPTIPEIEEEAKILASNYAESEPGLKDVFWFENLNEIRIIDVVENYHTSGPTEKIDIFVFDHLVNHQPVKLLVGTIPPDLVNSSVIPEDWGGWSNAKKVYP